MKKLFLIRTLTILIPFSLCAFTGCGSIDVRKFNAKIVDTGLSFKEDFLKANRTYGAVYMDDSSGKYIWDQTSPKFRTYIITEKVQLDEVFSVFSGIDFKEEMIVMYAYTSEYNSRQLKITSITLNNKNLKIEFKYKRGKPGHNDASEPINRFLVIRMGKLDIEAVEFKLVNP